MKFNKIQFIIIIFISQSLLLAQDSLYLITSFTGERSFTNNQIISNIESIEDINGDGYMDFITSYANNNYCKIYYGGNNFNKKPDIIIKTPQKLVRYFGSFMGGVGDVNNDGFDDFIITGKYYDGYFNFGRVFLYQGGTLFDTIPDFVFNDNLFWDELGLSINGGDINGDGYYDFVINNPYNWYDGKARGYLFFGNDTIADTSSVTFKSNAVEDSYGFDITIEGDINGDGFNDIIMTDLSGPNNINEKNCLIYYGASELKTTFDYSFIIDVDSKVKVVGDVNNDGYDDFLISEGTVNPRLYFGSVNFNANNFLEFSAYKKNDNFGVGFGGIGDINNDGYDDFALNIKNYKNKLNIMVSKLNIYLGGAVIDTIPDFSLEGETKWGQFGRKVGGLGDINGDGFNEFYVFASFYPNSDFPLGKVYIYSMKKFIVSVEKEPYKLQQRFTLHQNYPNPFNPSTTISYQLPKAAYVTLKVYDVLGKEVEELVNKNKSAGIYNVTFNADDLPSGLYFYKIEAGKYSAVRKMMLMK